MAEAMTAPRLTQDKPAVENGVLAQLAAFRGQFTRHLMQPW
jgi:hypothetical protein